MAGAWRHRLVDRAARRARRRHPRRHAVPVRQPGRMHHRESGRINLGLEGTLVMGAMSGYGISYLTGSPWLGVLAAGVTGAAHGRAARRHLLAAAGQRHRRRHRLDAVRHRPRLLSRQAADPADGAALPAIDLGWWSDIPQLRAALRINVLFLIGVALAPVLVWALRHHALGPDRPHRRRKRRRGAAPWAIRSI